METIQITQAALTKAAYYLELLSKENIEIEEIEVVENGSIIIWIKTKGMCFIQCIKNKAFFSAYIEEQKERFSTMVDDIIMLEINNETFMINKIREFVKKIG